MVQDNFSLIFNQVKLDKIYEKQVYKKHTHF